MIKIRSLRLKISLNNNECHVTQFLNKLRSKFEADAEKFQISRVAMPSQLNLPEEFRCYIQSKNRPIMCPKFAWDLDGISVLSEANTEKTKFDMLFGKEETSVYKWDNVNQEFILDEPLSKPISRNSNTTTSLVSGFKRIYPFGDEKEIKHRKLVERIAALEETTKKQEEKYDILLSQMERMCKELEFIKRLDEINQGFQRVNKNKNSEDVHSKIEKGMKNKEGKNEANHYELEEYQKREAIIGQSQIKAVETPNNKILLRDLGGLKKKNQVIYQKTSSPKFKR